jgi:3-oxoacyl-[acyl-carrier-protein] synthase-3
MYSRIAGTGSYLPEKVVTNFDLEKRMDTTDEWIRSRTGIERRHIAAEGQTTVDMAEFAARRAIEAAGVTPAEVDLIVFGTTTPDLVFPNCGTLLQARLGARGCPAFSVETACSGFIYALSIADKFVKAGESKCALVIGAETLSRITDWSDRNTAVLFGDGAGALVLTSGRTPGAAGLAPAVPAPPTTAGRSSGSSGPAGLAGLVASDLVGDPAGVELLVVPAGGSARPASAESVAARAHFLRMDGREVFRRAVRGVTASIGRTLEHAGCTPDDVALFVPHQANARIVDAVLSRTRLAPERTSSTIDRYGNTSAGSIPIALAEAADAGTVAPGDLVLMCGFGAGLSIGTALWRWGTPTRLSRGDT